MPSKRSSAPALPLYHVLSIPIGSHRLVVKRAKYSLFSERAGSVPSITLFGLRLTWRERKPA